MKNKLALAIGATVAAFCMSAPVFADTATTTVNVRSGPGTSYRVVGVLQAGDYVDVNRCTGGWCEISMRGPDGWVSSRFLSTDRPTRHTPPRLYAGSPGTPERQLDYLFHRRQWSQRGHRQPERPQRSPPLPAL